MVTAIVMIRTDKSRIPETAQEIAALDGVASVYSVTGAWDLVAMVRLRRYEELADAIADRLSKIDGIADTETMLAFRSYSRDELDEGWALGFEG